MEKYYKLYYSEEGKRKVKRNIPINKVHEVDNVTHYLQSTGIEDMYGGRVCERDIVEFDLEKVNEEDGFWNSNAGISAKKLGLDSLIIVFHMLDERIVYSICFKKDGKLLTEKEEIKLSTGRESKNEQDYLHAVGSKIDGLLFIRYLATKDALKIIGNTVETEVRELVPMGEYKNG